MLADSPIDTILIATDLAASREFYEGKLGLEVVREDDRAIEFRCGGGSHVAITLSKLGPSDEQVRRAVDAFAEVMPSQASWRVSDLAAEVAALRARGVEFMEYDLPSFKTVNGIADLGFALAAWFIDPASNTLGILEYR
jgi:catechol 2,3-dioxygenase-like lactoylglutathione lyase family enzyme